MTCIDTPSYLQTSHYHLQYPYQHRLPPAITNHPPPFLYLRASLLSRRIETASYFIALNLKTWAFLFQHSGIFWNKYGFHQSYFELVFWYIRTYIPMYIYLFIYCWCWLWLGVWVEEKTSRKWWPFYSTFEHHT